MSENGEQNYNVKKYRTPDGVPADIVMFTLTKRERKTVTKTLPIRELKVMLIRRKKWPFAGMWALPGGFCQEDESIYAAATRELKEETGVDGGHLEYLGVYSTPGRDPRGWIISHAFFALVEEWMLEHRQASDDAGEVGLFTMQEAMEELELAFDHRDIIKDAYLRIQQQMLQTTIARQFLPRHFTLSELYQVIQTVVPEFKEPNFIRKITSTRSRQGILKKYVMKKVMHKAPINTLSVQHNCICSQITSLCCPSIRSDLNQERGLISCEH